MTSDKKPTQAMPDDGLAGAADGTNRPGEAQTEVGHKGKRSGKGFEGGQSVKGYHGSQQLGDEEIEGKDNPNAGTRQG